MMIHQDDTEFWARKKKAELRSAGQVGHLPLRGFYWVLVTGYYLLSESSLASFILADSSFFCTRATSV